MEMSCVLLCFAPHFNMANKNAFIPASTAVIAILSPSVKRLPSLKTIASTYILQRSWQLLRTKLEVAAKVLHHSHSLSNQILSRLGVDCTQVLHFRLIDESSGLVTG